MRTKHQSICYFVLIDAIVITGVNDPLNTGKNKVKAFFAFGRMNPPTVGHLRVIEKLREQAKQEGAVVRVYLSKTHDKVRNPLTPDQKLAFIKRLFPEVDVRLSQTVFTAALEMAEEGIDNGVLIVGEDRLSQFSKILSAYSGTEVLGLKADVLAISRDESEASATQARKAALDGDLTTFRVLCPTNDPDLSNELYEAVRHGLGA